ncbi:hypothetical protein MSG28_000903 [Choristoneura fumiferana]|uniref:Uncharacterized protein n=1 Tax=Choristoneura fumiferana TaxID=7141 RepID=A0ACC0K2Y7_CHOFU|nr:hypothetical protein MSG28_000903 [Choristoneura fumiferana]
MDGETGKFVTDVNKVTLLLKSTTNYNPMDLDQASKMAALLSFRIRISLCPCATLLPREMSDRCAPHMRCACAGWGAAAINVAPIMLLLLCVRYYLLLAVARDSVRVEIVKANNLVCGGEGHAASKNLHVFLPPIKTQKE